MDFLSEFGKRVSNVARSVTDKGRDNSEAARLTEELRAAGVELDRLFAAYGRLCFAGGSDAAVADLEAQIRANTARVEALSARREDWMGARRCASCGAAHPKSARYCSNCGKRLAVAPAEPLPEPKDEEYCPRCGAAMAEGARFCPVCGAEPGAAEEAPPEPFVPDAQAIARIDVEEPAPGGEE